jgi:hypothetical protein
MLVGNLSQWKARLYVEDGGKVASDVDSSFKRVKYVK